MSSPEQFKQYETNEGGSIESTRTEYDILTEVEPFDKKQAEENTKAAKQQIEQERSQEKILDPRVEPLAIPLARDYAEKNYPKMKDGTLLPAWRGVNGEKDLKNKSPYHLMVEHVPEKEAFAAVIDIANTPYNEYSEYWKEQNRGGAEFLIKLMDERGADTLSGLDLTDEKTREEYGALIHDNWLERNEWVKDPEYGDPTLAKPYAELPEAEQQKDIDQLAVMQEWLKDQKDLQHSDANSEKSKAIDDELIGKLPEPSMNASKYIRNPEMREEVKEIISSVDDVDRLIEERPYLVQPFAEELMEKGADPLQFVEAASEYMPHLERIAERGVSWDKIGEKITSSQAYNMFDELMQKGVSPDILASKLDKKDFQQKIKAYAKGLLRKYR